MNNKGQSLVEIFIVVAIVALLAAIAIPQLMRAKGVEDKAIKAIDDKQDAMVKTHIVSTDEDGNKLYRFYDNETHDFVYYAVTPTQITTQFNDGSSRHPDVKQVTTISDKGFNE